MEEKYIFKLYVSWQTPKSAWLIRDLVAIFDKNLKYPYSLKVIDVTEHPELAAQEDIICTPEYFDITLPAGSVFNHPVPPEHTVFAYLMQGQGYFDEDKNVLVDPQSTVLFSPGDSLHIATRDEDVRFLLVAGAPLKEPVAWYGPIVMNTQEELRTAFEEFQNETFLKHKI